MRVIDWIFAALILLLWIECALAYSRRRQLKQDFEEFRDSTHAKIRQARNRVFPN